MRCSVIVRKIRKRIDRVRWKPIEVYVFHAVSEVYDSSLNMRIDWTSTQEFKANITAYQSQFDFISLQEAYNKLGSDWTRRKSYAVLTCDDGYESVLSVLPFLEEQRIPITLFVNPKYLDGRSKREGYAENPKYISQDELWQLKSTLVTVGMHGYEHDDATQLSKDEFSGAVDMCVEALKPHPRYIPFFAYTWGKHTEMTQSVLKEKKLVPVLTDGEGNYRYREGISRKPIDSYYLEKQDRAV